MKLKKPRSAHLKFCSVETKWGKAQSKMKQYFLKNIKLTFTKIWVSKEWEKSTESMKIVKFFEKDLYKCEWENIQSG